MREVYQSTETPSYLDATAIQLLHEGRAAYSEAQLSECRLLTAGADTHVLTWRGTAMNSVLAVLLTAGGYDCEPHDLGVTIADVPPDGVVKILKGLTRVPSADELSDFVGNLKAGKYDEIAPEPLLRKVWATAHQSACEDLPQLLSELVAR